MTKETFLVIKNTSSVTSCTSSVFNLNFFSVTVGCRQLSCSPPIGRDHLHRQCWRNNIRVGRERAEPSRHGRAHRTGVCNVHKFR